MQPSGESALKQSGYGQPAGIGDRGYCEQTAFRLQVCPEIATSSAAIMCDRIRSGFRDGAGFRAEPGLNDPAG
jgi:hypothetical protein